MQKSSTSIIRHASFFRRTTGTGIGILRRSFHLLPTRRANPNNVYRKTIHRAFFAPALSPDETPTLTKLLTKSDAIGTVVTAQAIYMRVVVVQDGGNDGLASKKGLELLCVVREVLKKVGRIVMVGDRVLVKSIDWIDGSGVIENVFQRRSQILEPRVANLDHLLLLFSLDQPKLEPSILTRFLVEAESLRLPLTLALNKCDLITLEEVESWKQRLRSWHYEPLFCSVKTNIGLDEIALKLQNQTTVIVGPSGVGKSSLINIMGSSYGMDAGQGEKWAHQRVNNVSMGNGYGRHTTRNVMLLPLCGGGYLADTPGFNKHKLLKVTKQSLPLFFPEIRKMTEGRNCGFGNCLHVRDAPGCVVNSGWERYRFYLQLLDEIKIEESSQLKKYGTKREDDVRYKVGEKGVRQAEPRIDPKKYKRESRKKMKQTIASQFDEF